MRSSLIALVLLGTAMPAFAADVLGKLASPDSTVRREAIASLRARGEEAVPDLRRGLGDGHPGVVLACLDLAAEGRLRRVRDAVRGLVAAEGTTVLVRPFDQKTRLGTVTAKSRHGRVNVDVDKHPRGPDGWWRLALEVPDSADVGKLDDVIEVHTEVPGEEITEITVRGEVLDLGR